MNETEIKNKIVSLIKNAVNDYGKDVGLGSYRVYSVDGKFFDIYIESGNEQIRYTLDFTAIKKIK